MAEHITNEVMFNIGVADAILMSSYKNRALKEWRNGQITDWFYTLNVMRENITPNFVQKLEHYEDDCVKYEKMISKIISQYSNCRRQRERIKLRTQLGNEVKEYQRVVFKAMKELGYLPSKRDRTKLGF